MYNVSQLLRMIEILLAGPVISSSLPNGPAHDKIVLIGYMYNHSLSMCTQLSSEARSFKFGLSLYLCI